MEDLTKASHKLAEEIYKQAATKQQGQASGNAGGASREESAQAKEEEKSAKGANDEDIIDAEYKEEDDKK